MGKRDRFVAEYVMQPSIGSPIVPVQRRTSETGTEQKEEAEPKPKPKTEPKPNVINRKRFRNGGFMP